MPRGLTVVLMQPGKPLELETLPTPEVEPGGILIKNTAAAICGSDLHYWRNDNNYSGPDIRRVPGHEFTGVVHTLGRGVDDRLAAAAAQGGRSRRLPVLQPVQPLLLVRARRAPRLPAPAPQEPAVHAERVRLLRRRLRRVLLPAARPLRLHGARRAARRRHPAGELRALPGAARPRVRGHEVRRRRGHPGRRRPRHLRLRGRRREGRVEGHRDRQADAAPGHGAATAAPPT